MKKSILMLEKSCAALPTLPTVDVTVIDVI
jgi:hypothetical protein